MTISYIGKGTDPTGSGTGTGSTSISPDLPGSRQNGDMLVMFVSTKPSSAVITTPDNWSRPSDGNASGGTGSAGADTGPLKCHAYYRLVDGNETAPSVAVTTSPSSSWAQIFLFRSTYGLNMVWSISAAKGSDDATGSSWSVTYSTDPDLQAGDFLVIGSSTPTDVSAPNQFNTNALNVTATGTTISTGTWICEPVTTVGNQSAGLVFTTDVSAGISSAAPVFSTTASGTTTNVAGPSVLLRMREIVPLRVGSSLSVNRQTINRASFW